MGHLIGGEEWGPEVNMSSEFNFFLKSMHIKIFSFGRGGSLRGPRFPGYDHVLGKSSMTSFLKISVLKSLLFIFSSLSVVSFN